MSTELLCLVWSTLLGFLYINAQTITLRIQERGKPYDANRDHEPPLGPHAGRASRALRNFLETYPLFIALAAAIQMAGAGDQATAWGAIAYLVGRTAYLPLYIAGIGPVRSLFWGVSLVGLGMMFYGALL
mgnify:CR=1 FL=1|jgi:uncharacterized MAPEG superfamily protein